MKLPLDDDLLNNGPNLLNEHLPPEIRVLCVRRAAPSFNAWKKCDSRTYSYTLPTFALCPPDEVISNVVIVNLNYLHQLTTVTYRIPEKKVEEVDDLLGAFIGTHNFFNYTSKR